MTLDHVLALQATGAQVLDMRDPAEFAAAHLAGSINIGLGGQYATWAGTVLSREQPIVIIADPGREHEAAMRLGPHRLRSRRRLSRGRAAQPRVAARADDVHRARQRAGRGRPRGGRGARDGRRSWSTCARRRERQQKRIAGSVGMPLNHLGERLSELPTDRPLLVYCAGGYRSSIAASLLQRHGFTQVSEIAGGIAAWDAARLPLEP